MQPQFYQFADEELPEETAATTSALSVANHMLQSNKNCNNNYFNAHLKIMKINLIEKVFVSKVAVTKWESGRGYPNLDSLKKIAKILVVLRTMKAS